MPTLNILNQETSKDDGRESIDFRDKLKRMRRDGTSDSPRYVALLPMGRSYIILLARVILNTLKSCLC
jgi:hypothetical protein